MIALSLDSTSKRFGEYGDHKHVRFQCKMAVTSHVSAVNPLMNKGKQLPFGLRIM